MTAAPALALVDVVKRYGPRTVLAGVSLEVQAGEIVALLGPNGAGKTTAVEILEGYRVADGGEVRVLGQDPRLGGGALKARVGLMLQGGGLDPRSTPAGVIHLYARLHDGPRDPVELLSTVGLGAVAGTRIRRLSGGERQRLALALALVGDPEVLLLDEPTAGMDPEARRSTRALIAGLRASGRAILVTTHDLADVERLADRVAILHGGRIVASGSPGEVAAGAEPRLRFRLARALEAPEIAALARALAAASEAATAAPQALPEPAPEAVPEAGDRPGSYRVDGAPPGPALVAALATWCAGAGIQIVELRAAAATLEERYLELTGDRDVEAVA
ncbi:MAG: ABC transporter ATP-binding protein [Chloroflexi bacterium]|nr:ABC transporter ATP-binding protein [Chloroflexota bacterium]